MKTKHLIAAVLLASTTASFSQVNIGSTATPHASSILEVTSTEKGLLLPRLTQAQRDAVASPSAGLAIYNTTEKCINFYNGTTWNSICDGVGTGNAIHFNKRLGGSGGDTASSVKQTTDGGYIMVGTISSSASGDVSGASKGEIDVWVVKLKADGTIEWEKNYGGSGRDAGMDILQTADGDYVVLATTNSSVSGDVTGAAKGGSDVWVLKLDASGNITWQKRYGGSAEDSGHSIQQTTDGGYIVNAQTWSSASGDMTGNKKGEFDVWVLKLDASGNITWQKNYGCGGANTIGLIDQTADGGYIFTASINPPGTGDSFGVSRGFNDIWVVKLTASGSIAWEKNYGGSSSESGQSLRQTTDGGYIVTGYTSSSASGEVTGTNNGWQDIWVLKLDASGNITWQKNYGGSRSEYPSSIEQTTDGGYIIGGISDSSATGDVTGTSKGDFDYWIIKIDALGSITWQKNYGGAGEDNLVSVQQTADGRYVVAGYSAHVSATNGDQTGIVSRGGNDIWVFTLDENGNIIP